MLQEQKVQAERELQGLRSQLQAINALRIELANLDASAKEIEGQTRSAVRALRVSTRGGVGNIFGWHGLVTPRTTKGQLRMPQSLIGDTVSLILM